MKYLIMLLALVTSAFDKPKVDNQLPIKYPAEVYKMSDAEFFKWATDFNKKQVTDLETRRANITEDKWINGMTTRTRAEYDYGCSSYGCNSQYGSSSRETTSYPVRWSNPSYSGPGPLTTINPYCRPTK
jgi:hypothetical protein